MLDITSIEKEDVNFVFVLKQFSRFMRNNNRIMRGKFLDFNAVNFDGTPGEENWSKLKFIFLYHVKNKRKREGKKRPSE